MKKIVFSALLLIFISTGVLADIERTYVVTSSRGCSYECDITIKGASGTRFDVYYTSGIGVNVGSRVIVLFDNNDNWKRISNASTGVSAIILRVN
jgi:hypothetical protein